jgi:hypothetical protein
MKNDEITTIKLNRKTKERLDKLRVHKRETYDEILQRVLSILNICITNPELARSKLASIERQKKVTKQKDRNSTPRAL